MRLKALAGFLMLLAPAAAWAAGGPREQALSRLRPILRSQAFSAARLSSQEQLILEATDVFISSAPKRRAWVTEALAEWKRQLDGAGIPEEQPLAVVAWKGAGSLWSLRQGRAALLEEWADERPVVSGDRLGAGRFFGFLGGQVTRGGDFDSSGFNARLGSTLFQNHYDMALTFAYATVGSVDARSFGILGRALFPLSPGVGWNTGVQVSRFDPSSGDSISTLSAVAGLNFYLPGGSFDVTLQAGNNNTYGFLAGYTVFFTQK